MGGAESVSEGPPDACRCRLGVGVGVGHIYPHLEVTVPVRVAPTRGFWTEILFQSWTETAVSGVLFLTVNPWALGYKKCSIAAMGSKPTGHGEPLKEGIFPTNIFFSKKIYF